MDRARGLAAGLLNREDVVSDASDVSNLNDVKDASGVRDANDRTRRRFVVDEAAPLLERTPKMLDALLRGLPAGWLAAHEGGETWSAPEVIAHLIHGEHADWLPRVRVILESGDTRPFAPFDRFAHATFAGTKTLPELLDEFARLRAESLEALRALDLTEADLDRRGLHPALGPVTMRQLLATWVAHDLDHVMQISRLLARQYSDEVGPWRQYLRVISGQQG